MLPMIKTRSKINPVVVNDIVQVLGGEKNSPNTPEQQLSCIEYCDLSWLIPEWRMMQFNLDFKLGSVLAF